MIPAIRSLDSIPSQQYMQHFGTDFQEKEKVRDLQNEELFISEELINLDEVDPFKTIYFVICLMNNTSSKILEFKSKGFYIVR